MTLFMFCWFQKTYDIVPCDKLWERLQQAIKTLHTTFYAKIRIIGDKQGEVLSNIGVKQGYPLSPTLFDMYIDELEKHVVEINRDSPCLIWWSPSLFMLTMLFLSLNWDHAYEQSTRDLHFF